MSSKLKRRIIPDQTKLLISKMRYPSSLASHNLASRYGAEEFPISSSIQVSMVPLHALEAAKGAKQSRH
ncbi:MAG: hypothetical protein COB33_008685 [Thiotrichaceae bacterium]|nr:hypothetical protein [Thiotrichaceae bacterium]PCI11931.1 MAG: hypothetical protein COB71_10910 [Thiotrichales bacterium]